MLGSVISLFLIELSIVCHELGHAIAMRKMGVEFDRFSIGFPIPKIPAIRFSFRGVQIVISPILLGGFVQATSLGNEQMDTLSYDQQALIYGAGIIGNILFSGVILIGFYLGSPSHDFFRTLGAVAVLAGIWFFRRIFCSYIILFLGFIEAGYIFAIPFLHQGSALVGPIGIYAMAIKSSSTVSLGILMAAAISIAFAITNALPFIPFDGGKIFLAFLKLRIHRPRWESFVTIAGVTIVLVLFGWAFYNDIAKLFRH